MAWRAWIEAVQDNATPAENIWVVVLFRDPASNPVREFRKTFKYVIGTTREQFTAMVLAERNELRNLDQAKTVLEGAIGQEVT